MILLIYRMVARWILSVFFEQFSVGFSGAGKYVPCILKYVRHIFCLLPRGFKYENQFSLFKFENGHFILVFRMLSANAREKRSPSFSVRWLPSVVR